MLIRIISITNMKCIIYVYQLVRCNFQLVTVFFSANKMLLLLKLTCFNHMMHKRFGVVEIERIVLCSSPKGYHALKRP